MPNSPKRYSHVAIVLHWLMALLIIGMLAAGKYMTGLEENSSLRFDLTQWHKSFGFLLLALSILRLLWRMTHKPPALSRANPRWERFAASFTHGIFYVLMIFMPITGWLMVSASPLNISTYLFDLFRVPHLPVVSTAANREELAELFALMHEYASGIFITLLLLHIGAALRHQFSLKDRIFSRMAPDFADGSFADGARLTLGAIIAVIAVTLLLNIASRQSPPLLPDLASADLANSNLENSATNDSDPQSNDDTAWTAATVNYTLVVLGDEINGSFADAKVKAAINPQNPQDAALVAIVETASSNAGSPQIDDSLPGKDWFYTAMYPLASFQATQFEAIDDQTIKVIGQLNIRNISREISFPLSISNGTATGGFSINRLDYDLGTRTQPDDSDVAFSALIEFSFDI